MGIVAVAGGCVYKLIHVIWLKKFDLVIVEFTPGIVLKSNNLPG